MAHFKAEIAAANKRAADRLAKTPTATAARYDRRIGRMIYFSSGLSIAFGTLGMLKGLNVPSRNR